MQPVQTGSTYTMGRLVSLGDMLARLPAGERWVSALWLYLATLAVWLELFGTPPEHGTMVFAMMAALIAFACGLAPGVVAAMTGALSLWWFTLRTPDAHAVLSTAATTMRHLGASGVALAVGAAARRWTVGTYKG